MGVLLGDDLGVTQIKVAAESSENTGAQVLGCDDLEHQRLPHDRGDQKHGGEAHNGVLAGGALSETRRVTCVGSYICIHRSMPGRDKGCDVAIRHDILKGRKMVIERVEETFVSVVIGDGDDNTRVASLYILPQGSNWQRERAADLLDYVNACDIAGGDLNYRPTQTCMGIMYHNEEMLPTFPDGHVSRSGEEDTRGPWLLGHWPHSVKTVGPKQSKEWRARWCWRTGAAYTLDYFLVGRRGSCCGFSTMDR